MSNRRFSPPLVCSQFLTLFVCVGALTLSLFVLLSPAHAERSEARLSETVKATAQQLAEGRPSEAVRLLESLADEGARHPELSFNRALAYWERSKTPSAQTGDLGQAAAGFAEVLETRPGDAEARRGMEEVQLAVSRKNARGKRSSVSEPLGLLERALLGLGPTFLVALGGLGSVVLMMGIALRQALAETRRVAGAISIGIGAFFLLPSFLMAQARTALFRDAEIAVVVAERAQIVDEAGRLQRQTEPLAESTVVYVKRGESGFVQLVGLASMGHLRLGQLRIVGRAIR